MQKTDQPRLSAGLVHRWNGEGVKPLRHPLTCPSPNSLSLSLPLSLSLRSRSRCGARNEPHPLPTSLSRSLPLPPPLPLTPPSLLPSSGRGSEVNEFSDAGGGAQVWDGDFVDGRPVRPLWVV